MQRLRYSRYFKSFFIGIDIIVVALVFFCFFLRQEDYRFSDGIIENNFIILLILSVFWILLSGKTKLYSVPRTLTYSIYLERLATQIFIFIVGVVLLAKISDNPYIKEDRFLIATVLTVVLLFIKSAVFFTLKYFRSQGVNHRNIMFLAENPSTEIFRNILRKRKDFGYLVFDFKTENFTIEELRTFWKKNGIHTVFLPAQSIFPKDFEHRIFVEAEKNKVKISLIPDFVQTEFYAYEPAYLESLPILVPVKFPLDNFSNYIIKRSFDLLFSLIVLLAVCSWLFPILAVLIKFSSKGPVFFVQKRYGYHDEVFGCIKFRTMCVNEDSATKTTGHNDQRITKIGKFLRKTSLDELPQFVNVLIGDMSIVGPRPHMLVVDDHYKPKIGRYAVRSMVSPGITGLAQVNGLRGDRGNMDIQMKKRILADTYYVRNWSISLDIVIILRTLLLLAKGDKNAQ